MTAFPTYSTGTIAIGAGATSVVGTGSNWTGVNAVAGDLLVVAGQTVIISDVTDATHLVIDAWPFAAVTAASYKIYKVSPLRFVGGQAMLDVSTLVGALKTNGFYVFVGPDETVPDPSLGSDGQFALQANTGKLWEKVGGIWNFVGTQKGFGTPKPWDSVTNFQAFDVASDLGTSYVAIAPNTNQRPPNATFWTVLAAKGDTGETGSTGPVPLKPIVPWATGVAMVVGPPASFVSQSGSSYECLIAHTSGTFAADLAAGKWGLVAAKGVDGTGIGTVTSVTVGGTTITSSGTLPAVAYDAQQSLTGAQQAQARQNINVPAVGQCKFTLSGGNLLLSRYKGQHITINGVQCTIPAAGVTLAPTGLTANHVYLIFAVATAGVVTSLEVVDTGSGSHATSTAAGNEGVEIRSGSDTRTLVGMARINASSVWADTPTQRFVISWFNRRNISLLQTQVTITSIGNTIGERSPSNRCEFLTWGDEAVSAQSQVSMRSDTNGGLSSRVNFDGATLGSIASPDGTATNFSSASAMLTTTLSEGYHFSTWDGSVQNGTGVANVTNMAEIRG